MDEQTHATNATDGRTPRGRMAQLNAAARSGIAMAEPTADPFAGATDTEDAGIVYEPATPRGERSGTSAADKLATLVAMPASPDEIEVLEVIDADGMRPATTPLTTTPAPGAGETDRRRKRAARGEGPASSPSKGKTPALSAEDGQRIIALLELLQERIDEVDPARADGQVGTATTAAELATPADPQVVEVQPVVKSIERIGQTIRDRVRGLEEWTTGQTERQEELDRAYAAMTSEWYKITEQVPAVGRKLADLQGTIGRRQAEMEGTARTVKKVAVIAVVTIALAAVLALALLIGLVYLAARSHKLV